MSNPNADLVTFLAGAGLSLTKGTNLYQGAFRGPDGKVGRNAVFVYPSGSPPPVRSMGQTTEVRFALMLVQTRWAKYAEGNLKAQAIQNALQGASISGYLDVVLGESLPVYLGQDEVGDHLFLSTVRMVFNQDA